MWGTFEKRLLIGGVAAVWLCWMVLQCVWQMWGHWPQPPDLSGRVKNLALHRARHVLSPFATNIVASFSPAKDLRNPFFPNPSQPLPPPLAVVTRQVELVYQGFYATSQGEKRAYIQAGTQLIVGPVGTVVAADYAIADISPRTLTLANRYGKKITLDFTVSKTIEVPL